MESIAIPDKYVVKSTGPNQADVIIEPCYPGYGTTIGNALRRVMLSSLPGAAITSIKIKGATHEFATLPGVKEDVVEMILNFKKVRFSLHGVDETTVTLSVKGEKKVTAKDIKLSSEVELVSPDAEIVTLTAKDAEIEVELTIKSGRGYIPVESTETKKLPLGTIAIDAIFTPVKNVNYNVENVRVGQMTNYDKVIMSILTDGSVSPDDAVKDAAKILVEHFKQVSNFGPGKAPAVKNEVKDEKEVIKEDIVEAKPKKSVKSEDKTDEAKTKKKRGRPKKEKEKE